MKTRHPPPQGMYQLKESNSKELKETLDKKLKQLKINSGNIDLKTLQQKKVQNRNN